MASLFCVEIVPGGPNIYIIGKIFAIHYRIGKDIGAIREGGRVFAWDEYYKHDYGIELSKEELEK